MNQSEEQMYWFVMRDLKRPNAKAPAYKQLGELGFEIFTPLRWHLSIKNGKREREQKPFIPDLLFVHATRRRLDSIVDHLPTLQYRYEKGKGYRVPMTVPEPDMERFIHAVESSANPGYYRPDELSLSMYGRKIRIIGGNLNGYEGVLLSVRGSKTKRLLVELPNWLVAAVEVDLEYVEFL